MTDQLTELIYRAGPRADPAPIAAAVRSYVVGLLNEEEALWYEADGPRGQAARETIGHLRMAVSDG